MAINKKLSNFNTAGDYRNFLATSDFNCSDVSSIGTSIIPDNLDVEYNPCQMLFVNCKYYLPPTATKIAPIIDTITNGTIGCWYKQTTASTYTKLNTTDLVFYSAYTQNKITNLQFNTIGIANLKDDSNVEYILSAKSSADATITATDNCIQRGLITLSASTFSANGEAKNVYIKTAPGNPWKITNTNGWLTFSNLTGAGPTTLVVTASTNNTFDDRTGNITIEYTDVTYSATGSITQEGREREFIWNESSASILTIYMNWDETSVSKTYSNNFTGLTVNDSTSWVTSRGLTSNNANGTFTATTQQNTGLISRHYSFSILSNGATVGSIQIFQEGKPSLYFYVGNTASEATTSACTYASTVATGSASYQVYYKNNYNTTEINSLTFSYDTMFSGASFVSKSTTGQIAFTVNENSPGNPQRTGYIRVMSGSTEVARITVTQAAGDDKYFYWGNSGTATVSGGNATYTQTSLTCTYRTNYTTLTTGSSNNIVTAVTLNNGTLTARFTANSTYVQRTDTVTIYGDGVAVATFNFTQAQAPAPDTFYWGTTGTQTTSAGTATSGQTSLTCPYRTTYGSLTTASTQTWVTSVNLNSGTATFNFNTATTTADTEAVITIKNGSNTVGTFTLTRKAKAFFQWSNGSQSASTTITTASTTVTDTYTTNYTGLVLSTSNYTWLTNTGITNANGDGTFSGNVASNTATSERTAICNVNQGSSITVGQFRIIQNGSTPVTYSLTAYTGTSGTATAATIDSDGGNITIRVLSNQAWTGSSNQTWATISPTTGNNNGSVTVTVSSSTNTSSRSATITFTGAHGQVCTIRITQSAYAPPVTHTISVSYTSGGWQWTAGTTSNLSKEVTIRTNNQGWSGYDAPSWISVSPSTGSEGFSYATITCDTAVANERSYDVTFYGSVEGSDFVRVYQPGTGSTPVTYSLTAYTGTSGYQTSTNVDSGQTTFTVRVISGNQGWSVGSSTSSWLSASPSSTGSSGTKSVTVTVDANPQTSSRTGYIYFEGSQQGSCYITVSQAAKDSGGGGCTYDFYWDDTSTTSVTSTNLNATGGSSYEYFTKEGYTEISAATTPSSWLTVSTSNIGVYFTADTQTAGAAARSQTLTIQGRKCAADGGGWVNVGEITIRQQAREASKYFYWSNNSTSITVNIDWDDTSISESYTTNYTGLSIRPTTNTAPVTGKGLSGGAFTASTSENSSTSQTRSVTYYICTGTTTATSVGDITIVQGVHPPTAATLTSITLTIGSVPDIHADGGSVTSADCSSIKVTGNYSNGTSSEIANGYTLTSNTITGSDLGCTVKSRTMVGTLSVGASYGSFNDTDTTSVYQEANTRSTNTITGETTHSAHTATINGTPYYTISVSPSSKSVTASSGGFSVTVSGVKHTPSSAVTYDTWKQTTTPVYQYTSGCQSSGSTTTGTSVYSGSTSVTGTSETTASTSCSDVSHPTWVTGYSTTYIGYTANSGSERSGDVVYKVTADSSVTGACSVTQDAAAATRTVTVNFDYWEFYLHSVQTSLLGESIIVSITARDGNGSGNVTGSTDLPLTVNDESMCSLNGSLTWTGVTTGATTLSVHIFLEQGNVAHGTYIPISGNLSDLNNLGTFDVTGHEGEQGVTISVSSGTSNKNITIGWIGFNVTD